MQAEDYQFFQTHGYVSLGKIFTADEAKYFLDAFDQDRANYPSYWYKFGGHQTINCDSLASTPEFDQLIRHPEVMIPLQTLMGGLVCFSEICIRHMAPYDDQPNQGWHRDRPHWFDHPLRMDYIQLMVYLTDVDQTTHCFSISPEGIDQEVLGIEEQLDRTNGLDLHGPAGTAILFNVSVLHTATTRITQRERKTVQIYYGHRDRPFLSNDSIMPPTLCLDHPDPEVRAFYGVLNGKTRTYLERTKAENTDTRQELSVEEMGKILYQIDIENRKRH